MRSNVHTHSERRIVTTLRHAGVESTGSSGSKMSLTILKRDGEAWLWWLEVTKTHEMNSLKLKGIDKEQLCTPHKVNLGIKIYFYMHFVRLQCKVQRSYLATNSI